MFEYTYNKNTENKRGAKAPLLIHILVKNYFLTKKDITRTNTINPINPPFTSISIRAVILPTTSNPRTEVPVNTNHKIANGIIPIKTPESPFTKSFTILNTFFMLIKFN